MKLPVYNHMHVIDYVINAVISYSMLGLVSTRMGDHLQVGKPPRFVTSYSGQLSLRPSAGGKWVPSRVRWRSVAGSKGRYGSFHLWMNVWWQVKLCDPSLTRAIHDCFRDEFLMIKSYTNIWLLYFTSGHVPRKRGSVLRDMAQCAVTLEKEGCLNQCVHVI